MNEHVEFEILLAPRSGWSLEASEHVATCTLCRELCEDLHSLEVNLGGLMQPVTVTLKQDEAIHRDVKERARQIRRILFWRRLIKVSSAVAAIVMIGLYFNLKSNPPVTLTCDFNKDKKVDIVDVFLLAAALENQQSEMSFDINNDGHFNEGDLNELRRQIVHLRELD